MQQPQTDAPSEYDVHGRGPRGWLAAGFDAAMWQRMVQLDRRCGVAAGGQADAVGAADTGSADAAASMAAAKSLASAPLDFDVALVGGGLHVVLAPLLARRGLRVVVIERARAASAQRAWFASAGELEALVRAGLCTSAELAQLVVARYDAGTCAWHGGGSYEVKGVLDCAVDAQALLQLARQRGEKAGVVFWDGVVVHSEQGSDAHVRLMLGPSDEAGGLQNGSAGGARANVMSQPRTLHVAAMVDARGASSPYNKADLVCPTVGGVLEGLAYGSGTDRLKINARIGEVLATTEDVEDGRQHIWEAFPTRTGQVAIYLFYYSQRTRLPAAPLGELYARFVATLPRFKEGTPKLVRPTFGLIPGWSRMTPPSRSPHRRILLVGDAASRHSPLTFCGFGAMLRSLSSSVDAVVATCANKPAKLAVDDRALHRVTGALASMLANPPTNGSPERLNRLLDHAFATLHQLGNPTFAGLLQDTLPAAQALKFLWTTSRSYPQVWRDVQQMMGFGRGTRWALSTGLLALRRGQTPFDNTA